MSGAGAPRVRRRERGLSLLELIVAIVLLAILGAGFMTMYGDVTRHNAGGLQIAPMTWVAQGIMEYELLQTELSAPGTPQTINPPLAVGPYQVSATYTTAATKTVSTGTYYAYRVTVTVTCASGTCSPLTFTSYVYST